MRHVWMSLHYTRLSKLITECLKLVCSHCTAYCKMIRERTGVNSMWIINNSLDVIRTVEEKQLSLTYVSTWDFSTLYTSLPHARLKNQLHDLLERVFHTKGKSFIATNSPFPNYLWPLFQSESWCSSFHMKISFHLHVIIRKWCILFAPSGRVIGCP